MNRRTLSALAPERLGLLVLAAAIAIWHTPVRAQADMDVAYAGLGFGQARYVWENPTPAANGDFCGFANLTLCRDRPTGFKGFVGYNITNWLGLEATYFNAGSAIIEYDQNLVIPPATTAVLVRTSERVTLAGFGVSAVGSLPVGPLFISGRIGVSATTASLKLEQLGQSTLVDKTKARPFFGVGAGGRVWRNVSVRLDWDRVSGVTAGNSKFRADLFTLNAMYRFE